MNPFTEQGRITNPQRFAGRWRELSLIFERLEAHCPIMIVGLKAIGKSSLLTHIAQSAATAMDRPELITVYMDLSLIPNETALYELIINELQGSGSTPAALEITLLVAQEPILLCLDGAESAIAAGWGNETLERLACIARGAATAQSTDSATGLGKLQLVTTVCGTTPPCSNAFTVLQLGAFSVTEVRLVAETYLYDTDIIFFPGELRELAKLSAGHPAYLQRAAFHLFKAKQQEGYNWHTSYIKEAQEQPVPGAPLPPGIFEGDKHAGFALSTYGTLGDHTYAVKPLKHKRPELTLKGLSEVLVILISVVVGIVVFQTVGQWWAAGGVILIGIIVTIIIEWTRVKQ